MEEACGWRKRADEAGADCTDASECYAIVSVAMHESGRGSAAWIGSAAWSGRRRLLARDHVRSHACSAGGGGGVVVLPRNPKVPQPADASAVEQHIRRLDVAVDDAQLGVKVGQAPRDV